MQIRLFKAKDKKDFLDTTYVCEIEMPMPPRIGELFLLDVVCGELDLNIYKIASVTYGYNDALDSISADVILLAERIWE